MRQLRTLNQARPPRTPGGLRQKVVLTLQQYSVAATALIAVIGILGVVWVVLRVAWVALLCSVVIATLLYRFKVLARYRVLRVVALVISISFLVADLVYPPHATTSSQVAHDSKKPDSPTANVSRLTGEPITLVGPIVDGRPGPVSLLNSPILPREPVVAAHPITGLRSIAVVRKGNNTQIVYNDGKLFDVPKAIYEPSGPPSSKLDEAIGTVLVGSHPLDDEKGPAENTRDWRLQIPLNQLRDINGDGWPEIVFSDYSGGLHCCTRLVIISLRPDMPMCVFARDLGSDLGPLEVDKATDIQDLDGDGRREIRTTARAEYALGTFAGTYGVPVIYSAGGDGVYRVNTRAYTSILEQQYTSAKVEYATQPHDSTQVQDSTLIDLFLLAYLTGHRDDAFNYLRSLQPLDPSPELRQARHAVALNSPPTSALDTLAETLKTWAPEVLSEPEWSRIVSGSETPVWQSPAVADSGSPQPAAPKSESASRSDTEGEREEEAHKCESEFETLKQNISSYVYPQRVTVLPQAVLDQIQSHNERCTNSINADEVIFQQRMADADRKESAKGKDNAPSAFTVSEPFVPPSEGWTDVAELPSVPSYIVLFGKGLASNCRFTVNEYHQAFDCPGAVGRSQYFSVWNNGHWYLLKSKSTPHGGEYAAKIKDRGTKLCLQNAKCYRVLAEVPLAGLRRK